MVDLWVLPLGDCSILGGRSVDEIRQVLTGCDSTCILILYSSVLQWEINDGEIFSYIELGKSQSLQA